MSTPSTTIITNLKTVTPSTANTLAAANSHGIDMPGMLSLALSKASELKVCLTLIVGKMDGADPNLATLNNILASIV
ncbi:MAG: hypothetical protein ABSF93_21100 [Candidatus Sulfotelmatobacter sp.]|jgi:hypothetical protein